jgi:hypothetical protein
MLEMTVVWQSDIICACVILRPWGHPVCEEESLRQAQQRREISRHARNDSRVAVGHYLRLCHSDESARRNLSGMLCMTGRHGSWQCIWQTFIIVD